MTSELEKGTGKFLHAPMIFPRLCKGHEVTVAESKDVTGEPTPWLEFGLLSMNEKSGQSRFPRSE